MIEVYDQYKTTILGVQKVPENEVDKYGIVSGNVIGNRVYRVKDLIEKPSIKDAPSNIAIIGRYIISPEIFKILKNTKPGKNGEIQLTDALKELAKHEDIYAYSFEGRRYDVGNKLGFLEATVEYALRNRELREGFINYLVEIVAKEGKDKQLDEIASGEEI